MIPLVANLPPGARVLDLGAAGGSFVTPREDILVVRVDLAPPLRRGSGTYVAADAARLPFSAGVFDLIVSNHSLEHFPELENALREVGRVLKPGGALYIAVPDASTLTDRIYRWVGRGGGHVNAFRSSSELASLVKRLAGTELRGTCDLGSGLSFLNAHNFTAPPPRKIALFAFGNEGFLAWLLWLLRWADGVFGARLSQYGWAFYFGSAEPPQPPEFWPNVCVRCGSAHSVEFLKQHAEGWRKVWWISSYRCPQCGGFNLLSEPVREPAAQSPAVRRR